MTLLTFGTAAMALTDPSAGKVRKDTNYGTFPLFFIPNQGQFDDQVAYAFPVTVGPDLTHNSAGDTFVAKIAPVPEEPVAGFTATPTSGPSPLSAAFTNQSTGDIISWAWDFDNNGSVDSTDQNPTYEYSAAGSYTVTLTVERPGGFDAETKTNYIVVSTPVADADGDGIPNAWELLHFGDTTDANGSTDWDKDGYTDLKEYLNKFSDETDPEGDQYDPKTINAPVGTGYVDSDSDFWTLMIPVITNKAGQP